MNQLPTYDRILRLRAIRQYSAKAVEGADVTRILDAARWTGSSKNSQAWSVVVVSDAEQRLRLAGAGRFTGPIEAAPLVMAVVEERGGNEFDTGRMAQNIMLAADSIGMVSCPVTLHDRSAAADVLGLPEGVRCRYAVALGYPSAQSAAARIGGRKPLEEFVHFERY